jgi:hypothetical protein
MSEIIKFIAQNEHIWQVGDRPFPAIKKINENWKSIPKYSTENNTFDMIPSPTVTVKQCVPTLEMLGAGYYMPLYSDCFVQQKDNLPTISWAGSVNVFDVWSPHQVSNFELDENCSNVVFKYHHGWTIKTPPGWSCLFLHPVSYPNLPFKSISGIVDTDIYDGEINVPIILKKDFKGILEKGTPMFQIIPFKRSTWKSEFNVKAPNQHFFDQQKLYSKLVGAYRSLIKDKKSYS